MGVLVVHGAGYETDPALRFLKRQRLRSGLVAGFVSAKRVSLADALNESADTMPFPVRMVEYSHALNEPTAGEPELPDPPRLAETYDWQPIPKARCLCCVPRRFPYKANMRDWAGNIAKDNPTRTGDYVKKHQPDVHRYVTRGDGRAGVLSTVLEGITPDVRVVIGHSLGSVVLVDTLARVAGDAAPDLLVTIGSPLRHPAIRQHLDAATTSWIQRRPTPWLNVHDRGDIATAGGSLPLRHFPGVINLSVDNHDHSHAGDYYLRHPIVGQLIWDVAAGVLEPDRLRTGIPADGVYGTLFKER